MEIREFMDVVQFRFRLDGDNISMCLSSFKKDLINNYLEKGYRILSFCIVGGYFYLELKKCRTCTE